MDVVNLCFYARAHYSEAEHEENILIPKDVFDKVVVELTQREYVIPELDGKFSETPCELEVQYFTEDDIKEWNKYDIKHDEYEDCWNDIIDIFQNAGFDLETVSAEAVNYCQTIAKQSVTVSYTIPESKLEELNAFVHKLCEEA